MGKKFFILIDFWPITALIAICMLIFSAIHKKPLLIFIRAKDKKFARYKTSELPRVLIPKFQPLIYDFCIFILYSY